MTRTDGSVAAESAAPAAAGGWAAAATDLPTATYWAGTGGGATLLDGGSVLLAGGEDAGRNAQSEAAVFDPTADSWSATTPMSISRRLHTCTKLKDGSVLVVGGITGPFAFPPAGVASAEIYHPGTQAWESTGALNEARYSHSATLLDDGRVLVAGGITPRSSQSMRSLASAEIYDPNTREWTRTKTPMNDARSGHPAVPLSGNRVLVVGGMVAIGRGLFSGQSFCEIYDVGQETWTPTGSMLTVRKSHQATVLNDGSVLVTGGDSPGLQQDWTFNPYSQWTTERFDPGSGVWSPADSMPTGRSHHRAIALDSGKVLVIGGTDDATFDVGYQNATVYDPQARSWTPTGPMVTGRWAFAATELADGRVLVAGGLIRSGAAAPDNGDLLTATSEVFTA